MVLCKNHGFSLGTSDLMNYCEGDGLTIHLLPDKVHQREFKSETTFGTQLRHDLNLSHGITSVVHKDTFLNGLLNGNEPTPRPILTNHGKVYEKRTTSVRQGQN